MKKNMCIIVGLVLAVSGMGLIFVDMTPLTVYCDGPYGTTYDCTPYELYIPPVDPCINNPYCSVTTTSTAYTTTTTTIIDKVTSTQTLTNTVTDIRAIFVTSTVLDSTTSTITETSTIALFSTTIITINDQLSTITQTITDNETEFAIPLNQIGIVSMLVGSATMIIGVKKKK
ncbi:hypothetical protein ACFL96_12735 [Thermoproteota archaeon]